MKNVFLAMTLIGYSLVLQAQNNKTDVFHSKAHIKLMLPRDSSVAHVLSSQLQIKWSAPQGASPYIVVFKNVFKETLYTLETAESQIQFNFSNDIVIKEKVLYVVVVSKADRRIVSAEHVIKRAGFKERNKIERALSEVTLGNSKALDQLILAGFYEKNGLYIEAVDSYIKSVHLSQDAEYQEAFDLFLTRNGFAP